MIVQWGFYDKIFISRRSFIMARERTLVHKVNDPMNANYGSMNIDMPQYRRSTYNNMILLILAITVYF